MLNGSVLKKFIRPKAEPYQFPDALTADDAPGSAPQEKEDLLAGLQDELFVDGGPRPRRRGGAEDGSDEATGEEKASPAQSAEQLKFAQVQAEAILRSAREEAEKLRADAAAEARAQAERIREEAQRQGYQDGYAAGSAGAEQDLKTNRETQAAQMQAQLRTFLENAAAQQDQMMDAAKTDMRDLAIAVAEKVIRISLKSSSGIIAKMIQDATEKMKRREWVRIYVSGCDAKGLAQITPRLTRALAGLSDHIRIVPVATEETGTCIIETPDTIIDASASTQMNNIRSILDGLPTDDPRPPGTGRTDGS